MTPTSYSQTTRRIAMIVATIMTFVYLVYRGLFTLNLTSPYAIAVSFLLYIPECYGSFLMFLFFFQVWVLDNPEPKEPLSGRSVDVMIPTYNEDPELLRGTITAALKIDYPHRTYVLDDGKRASVKALCEELGAEYVTRPTNLHAKAGNLNHALEMTQGEFVVIFDADHVAERHFIDRLIGYFGDEKLGFVQTPHAFYNFEAFQGVLNYARGVYWEEGMLFYNVLQPGKNYWNGVTFCGSAAMFRRTALEEVGLVATQSITEDMHTGLLMHSKGWKSLFVNERMIAAMAAPEITSFNTQRLRWGEGNLGIFAFANPLTLPGLTLAQRLCYLGSMLSWTTGVQKLLIYTAPILMLLTEVSPVLNFGATLATITVLYLAAIWGGVKIASNGYGRLLAIELTQMACFWTQTKSTWRAIFNRNKASFVVTSKRGRQSNSTLRHVVPQILYIMGSVTAITWAFTRLWLHLSDDFVGPIIGSALLLFHSYLAWIVVCRALRPKERRASWRHPGSLHVQYRIADPHGGFLSGQGVTRDLHESGIGFTTFDELPDSRELDLTISGGGKSVACRGQICSRRKVLQHSSGRNGLAQAFGYGIKFLDPSGPQLETLWWLGAQFNVSRQYDRFKGGRFGLPPLKDESLVPEKDEHAFALPLTIEMTERQIDVSVTEMIGPHTMTALLPAELDSSRTVKLKMATPFGAIQAWGEVEDVKPRMIAGQTIHETRFRYRRFFAESRSQLHSTLGHRNSRELAPIARSLPSRRQPNWLRPGTLVLGAASTAAVLVVGMALILRRDDAAIAQAESGKALSAAQTHRLVEMVSQLRSAPKLDETSALRLRGAMMQLGREADVAAIDDVLARSTPTTLNGQIVKAASLQNEGKAAEAEQVFEQLLSRFDELGDDRTKSAVLLAAARNAANIKHFSDAAQRFEKLQGLGPLGTEARREYAGVLLRSGQPDRALALVQQGAQTPGDLRFLASIHSSERRFEAAMEIYRRLLAATPSDIEIRRGLADNALWAKQFAVAAREYGEILKHTPQDVEVQTRHAESLLYDHQYEAALAAFDGLLTRDPDQIELCDKFLQAAAGAAQLSSAERERLEQIYRQQSLHHDERLLASLLNAVSKHGEPAQTVPLLKALLTLKPDDATLRLRLADALHNLGRYTEAGVHFRWLLDHPAAEPDFVSPLTSSSESSR